MHAAPRPPTHPPPAPLPPKGGLAFLSLPHHQPHPSPLLSGISGLSLKNNFDLIFLSGLLLFYPVASSIFCFFCLWPILLPALHTFLKLFFFLLEIAFVMALVFRGLFNR